MCRSICVVLLLSSSVPASAQPPAASETTIRQIVAAQARAMYGAEALAQRHAQILATFYKGTTKNHRVRRIRFITPDVAIVDIDNEVPGVKAMPAGIAVPSDDVIRTQLMQVLVRRNGVGSSRPITMWT